MRLLVSVLVVGALLSWWGTRDQRLLFGDARRKPVAADGAPLPQVTQAESVLWDRGSRLSQQQCAGCHEIVTRASAPSYQEIVAFYRRQTSASPGNPDLRARLVSAVTHPRPGWGNFPRGPLETGLSLDDRVALVSWILHSLDRDSAAEQGLRQ